MDGRGVRAAVEVLVGTELSVAGNDELARAATAVARLQSFVDLAKVQIARRGRVLASEGDTAAQHVLIDEGRCTGNDAKATNGRDRVCGHLPAFETALAGGEITGGHLDALAQLTKDLTDVERSDLAAVAGELLTDAVMQPASLFERNAKAVIDQIREQHRPDSDAAELDRQRSRSKLSRWTDRETGMCNTLISLDPLRDESLWMAIDHHLATLRQDPANRERPFEELRVEAVLSAVSSPTASPTAGRRVPEIVVHTDGTTLCHGRHAETLAETADGAPVPVSTLQRLCCEAVLQAVMVRPDGTIDRLCAERRTANRQQRRLLEAMYSTCAHPHCRIPFSACRIHHVVWWTRGGRTVLANLLPLCETHHHLVHEGGWNLTIDEHRHVSWHRPDGTVWHTDDGPNRQPSSRPGRHGRDRSGDPPERRFGPRLLPGRSPTDSSVADVPAPPERVLQPTLL